MSRKKLIAGNWKMNLLRDEAVALARAIASAPPTGVELVVCPTATSLHAVVDAIRGSAVLAGGQNCWHENSGAFTGEISPTMLADAGCRYVILGHSERRQLMSETDDLVNRKLHAALAAGLIPIVCVGETLEQREAGQTESVTRQQMLGSLRGIGESAMEGVVIAYEPVWAIGTGKTATPGQAQEVHADLRKWLENSYNPALASKVRILYGGSVKADNAGELLSQPDIDGALVGGASLKADSFMGIAQAAS